MGHHEARGGGRQRRACRGRKIVALGASMSKFAIVVDRATPSIYEPEMLKDKPIAVTPNNGSHFTTLKMMEGFLEPRAHQDDQRRHRCAKRIEAVTRGKVAAVEPAWSRGSAWRRSEGCAS